jgi:hypothetical protein
MQHAIVAFVLGIKRKGWVANIRAGQLIPNCLRVFPPLSFDHSFLEISEQWRGRPEFMIGFLRLT